MSGKAADRQGEPSPEYCFRCRDTCPTYFERSCEGTAVRCLICGAGLDFIFDEDQPKGIANGIVQKRPPQA